MKSIQSAVFVMLLLTFIILQTSIAKATAGINEYTNQTGQHVAGRTLSNLSAAIKTTPLSLNVSGRTGRVSSIEANSISGGWLHALAVNSDRLVYAWGDNSYGQTNVPVGLSNVSSVAAGARHSLALLLNGTVVGWGSNDSGQISVPTGLSSVIQIDAASDFSCALKSDGTVVLWGGNSTNQLDTPEDLGLVADIECGNAVTYAVMQDGTVRAWGDASHGQTILPTGLTDVKQVSGGNNFAVALKNDGTVVAWGTNDFQQTQVPTGLTDVVAVSAGAHYAMALKRNGTVVGWGRNYYNQFALASYTDIKELSAGSSTVYASRLNGSVVAFGHTASGESAIPGGLAVYPSFTPTQTYTPSNTSTNTPTHTLTFTASKTPTNPGTPFAPPTTPNASQGCYWQDSAGVKHRYETVTTPLNWFDAITAARQRNINGTYGYLATVSSAAEQDCLYQMALLRPPGSRNFWIGGTDRIQEGVWRWMDGPEYNANFYKTGTNDTGWFNKFELGEPNNASNVEHCLIFWGDNYNRWNDAQCELPAQYIVEYSSAGTSLEPTSTPTFTHTATTTNTPTPTSTSTPTLTATLIPIPSTPVTKRIAGAYLFGLALPARGGVLGWGWNGNGQLTTPPASQDFVAISGGHNHVLALKPDGTVRAWGGNESGQISVPDGLSNVVMVSAGNYYSAALKGDGTVVAWGNNTSGQATVPSDLRTVVFIETGIDYMLAVTADGFVRCWGANTVGQCNIPTGLRNVTKVSASNGTSVALKSDGTVAAWGLNDFGQASVPSGLRNIIDISAGEHYVMALQSNKRTTGWGRTYYNWAGLNAFDVAEFEAGYSTVYALLTDGRIRAFGHGGFGETNTPSIDVWATATITLTPSLTPTSSSTSTPTTTNLPVQTTPIATPELNSECFWIDSDNNAHRYHFYSGAANWNAARTLAQSKTLNGVTGILATIPNAEVHNCIYSKLLSLPVNQRDAYIGGTDTGSEGVWRWLDGSYANARFYVRNGTADGWYSNFGSGQPDNNASGNVENCLAIWGSVTNSWNDVPCSYGLSSTYTTVVEFVTVGSNLHNTLTPTPRILKEMRWGFDTSVAGANRSYVQSESSVHLLECGTFVGQAYGCPTVLTSGGVSFARFTGAAGNSGYLLNYNSSEVAQKVTIRFRTTASAAPLFEAGKGGHPDQTWGYDRSVYLSAGKICSYIWGGWTEASDTLCTANTYNDGMWHTVTRGYGVTSDNKHFLQVDSEKVLGARISSKYNWDEHIDIGFGYGPSGQRNWYFTGDIDFIAVSENAETSAIDNPTATPRGSITPLPIYARDKIVAVGGGRDFTLVRDRSGDVWGWGNSVATFNASLANTGDIKSFAVGKTHALLLRGNGSVTSFSVLQNFGNDAGQMDVPAGLSSVVAVAAGRYTSYAITNDGRVRCWGRYCIGTSSLNNVTQLCGGEKHYLALHTDGTVTLGGDTSGVIGVPYDLQSVVKVACGNLYSLALKSDGTLVRLGQTEMGEIGIPDNLADIVDIAAGNSHAMALRSDGRVLSWNNVARTAGEVLQPSNMRNIVEISASADAYSQFALDVDGNLYGWGYNNAGQSAVPAEVAMPSSTLTPTRTLTPSPTLTHTPTPTNLGTPFPPPSTLSVANGCFWQDSTGVNHRYALVNASLSWYDAIYAAQQHNINGTYGYLATITSAAEQDCLHQLVMTRPVGYRNYWVSGTDREKEGIWRWMDGPESGANFYKTGTNDTGWFNKFEIGEPNNASNVEHCLILWGDNGNRWNDAQCELTGQFIVEYSAAGSSLDPTATATGTATPTATNTATPTATLTPTYTPLAGEIPKSLLSISDQCYWQSSTGISHSYKVINLSEPMDWYTAREAAEALSTTDISANLATIFSQNEGDCINRLVENSKNVIRGYNNHSWIGASNHADSQFWRWETGPERGTIFYDLDVGESSYSDWDTDANIEADDRCASIYQPTDLDQGPWQSISCNSEWMVQSYVVEFESASELLRPTLTPTRVVGDGASRWEFNYKFDPFESEYFSVDKARSFHCGWDYYVSFDWSYILGGQTCPRSSAGIASFSSSPLYSTDPLGSLTNYVTMKVFLVGGNTNILSLRTLDGYSFDRGIFVSGGYVCSELYDEETDLERICTRRKIGAGWHTITRGFAHNRLAHFLTVDSETVTGTLTSSDFTWADVLVVGGGISSANSDADFNGKIDYIYLSDVAGKGSELIQMPSKTPTLTRSNTRTKTSTLTRTSTVTRSVTKTKTLTKTSTSTRTPTLTRTTSPTKLATNSRTPTATVRTTVIRTPVPTKRP